MHWLQDLDTSLFHWVNPTLSNRVLDVLMPFCSGNAFFVPVFLLICIGLACRGGWRGRICVVMVVLAIGLGDTLVCNTLKQLIARPRPFHDILDVHLPPGVGRTESGSMPSSHAANWFAATAILFIYYRRSLWFMLPAALVVSFSRLYNGVHYPSDVLVGAILGAGYGVAGVWTCDAVWRWAGRRWFPLWWRRLPSLMDPGILPPDPAAADLQDSPELAALRNQQWLRLGHVLIFVPLLVNLWYLASAKINLEQDETYQWLWSKHLALSYYSKPPLIACTQWLGTHLWGDTAFGVRFFAPVITAVVALCTLRFLARVVNVRAAFWLTAALLAVPIFSLGTVLMTIDPLSVMFWTFAMIAGWEAVQENSSTRSWIWVGLWMGLGFLSKYTALFQWFSWAMFFCVWPPARRQLRRPGPWLALLLNLLCMLPVLVWNQQHHWITVTHVASDGGLTKSWAFTPANLWAGFTRYTLEFAGLKRSFSIRSSFFPWPGPPSPSGGGRRGVRCWFISSAWRRPSLPATPCSASVLASCPIGLPRPFTPVAVSGGRLLGTALAGGLPPHQILARHRPHRRRGHGRDAARPQLDTQDYRPTAGAAIESVAPAPRLGGNGPTRGRGPGKAAAGRRQTPMFIIGGHYGITSEVAFYLPAAKAGVPDHPLAYFQRTSAPENQFYFWPGYQDRKGQNAIYVQELDFDAGPLPSIPPEE